MPRGTGMTKTKRRKTNKPDPGTERIRAFLFDRLMNPDAHSHAEFLADMRAEKTRGRLTNPVTAALLARLERAIQ